MSSIEIDKLYYNNYKLRYYVSTRSSPFHMHNSSRCTEQLLNYLVQIYPVSGAAKLFRKKRWFLMQKINKVTKNIVANSWKIERRQTD